MLASESIHAMFARLFSVLYPRWLLVAVIPKMAVNKHYHQFDSHKPNAESFENSQRRCPRAVLALGNRGTLFLISNFGRAPALKVA